MKKAMSLLLMGFIGLVGTAAWAGSARQDTDARLQSSVDVLHAIMATPDKGIPEEVLSNAKCILVVPDLIKGGFIFGGKHGRGVASCRTPEGWSAPAFVTVGGGSWGLQIGVDAGHERPRFPASALEQVPTDWRRISCRRPSRPSRVCRNGLENEHPGTDLLALKGRLRRVNARRCCCAAGRRLDARYLWQEHEVSQHSIGESLNS